MVELIYPILSVLLERYLSDMLSKRYLYESIIWIERNR